jgi:hypothetical protein
VRSQAVVPIDDAVEIFVLAPRDVVPIDRDLDAAVFQLRLKSCHDAPGLVNLVHQVAARSAHIQTMACAQCNLRHVFNSNTTPPTP